MTAAVIQEYPKRIRQTSLVLFTLVLIALLYGVAFIYGTGQQTGGAFADMWKKQLCWIAIGSAIMILLAVADYRWLGRHAWWIYALSIGALVMVLAVGARINGSKSWIRLAPGVSIQPAEFAKITHLLLLSWVTSHPSVRFTNWRHLLPAAIVTGLPMVLIFLQPDWGSGGVLIPVTLGILFVSGIQLRWLAYGAVITALAAPPVYGYVLKEHQKKRIMVFLNPAKNPTNEGWNARQSLLAVGSGGLTGKGYMKGTQNVLGFLPQTVAPTDFIFSVVAEETGFVGSTLLLAVFGAILVMSVYIAMKAPDALGRNLACGIGILFCVHIYVNIGMTIGLAPIIGIPLPFVSYGGSFMIVTLAAVGVLQNVYALRRTY